MRRPVKLLTNRQKPQYYFRVYAAVHKMVLCEQVLTKGKKVINTELIEESEIKHWIMLKKWNEFKITTLNK